MLFRAVHARDTILSSEPGARRLGVLVVRGDREGRARAGTRRSRAGAARSLTISLFVEIPQLIRCGISTIMGRAAVP
jgi:hypothetical protein